MNAGDGLAFVSDALEAADEVEDMAILDGRRQAMRRLEPLWPTFVRAGEAAEIRPALLAGVAWTESSLRPEARNPDSGALGLMQVMPFHLGNTRTLPDGTTVRFGSDVALAPTTNVLYGASELLVQGWGETAPHRALGGYAGFDFSEDDTAGVHEYSRKVLGRATWIEIQNLLGELQPGG